MDKKNVLIVEDDGDAAFYLSLKVEEAGYSAHIAPGGQAALDYIATNPPSALVLLDLHMPVVTGDDVLSAMKLSPTWKTVFVLIITGDPRLAGEQIELPRADGVIVKPIMDPEGLVSAIRLYAETFVVGYDDPTPAS